MISNFKKLNFCNFSAHLPSLHNPIIFPFQGGVLRSRNYPSKFPAHSQAYALSGGILRNRNTQSPSQSLPACPPLRGFPLEYRSHPMPCRIPLLFPILGIILRGRISLSNPLRLPCFLPFQGASCRGRFMPKIMCFPRNRSLSATNYRSYRAMVRAFLGETFGRKPARLAQKTALGR